TTNIIWLHQTGAIAAVQVPGVFPEAQRPSGLLMMETTPTRETAPSKSPAAVAKPAPAAGCYVVTATYGRHSRQAALVHARCRRRFLMNPLLTIGWCLYKFYGPILGRWSQSSRIGFRL